MIEYLVTLGDKLYKVCTVCKSSQPHVVVVDSDEKRTVLACGRCSQVMKEVRHDE